MGECFRLTGLCWALVTRWRAQLLGPSGEGLDNRLLKAQTLLGSERFDASPVGGRKADLKQDSLGFRHLGTPPPIFRV